MQNLSFRGIKMHMVIAIAKCTYSTSNYKFHAQKRNIFTPIIYKLNG